MSDKLPFNDAFKNKMNDLPLGNEDAAWQKMNQLLNEKLTRKPFGWFNIYTICCCIIIFSGLGFWIIISYNNKQNNIAKTTGNIVINNNKNYDQKLKSDQNNNEHNLTETNKITIQNSNSASISIQPNKKIADLNAAHHNSLSPLENNKSKNFNTQFSFRTNQKKFTKKSNTPLTTKKENNNTIAANGSDSLQNENNNNQNVSNNNSVTTNTNSLFFLTEKNDSVTIKTNALSNLKKASNADSISALKQSPISFRSKRFFVEAGLQVKQQIPVNGQKIITYNYNGNKILFSDYIPSVFIKFEKDKQWFLQGEFSYTKPYLVKQFSYSRQTKVSYASGIVTIISNNLQKTYYNEIPISFNYYVHNNWFVGTGYINAWFHGAVAQQQTTTNDIKAGTISTSKTIIPFKNFTDSFLYKNQANLLLQTGYSLKRWSFILRYEKGIQPYIKYTLPNGAIESKRNSSIELNIGYRFIKAPF